MGKPDDGAFDDWPVKPAKAGNRRPDSHPMFATHSWIFPTDACGGRNHLHGKSISNRGFCCWPLCAQALHNHHDLLGSGGTRVMLQALRQLGCVVEQRCGSPCITRLASQFR